MSLQKQGRKTHAYGKGRKGQTRELHREPRGSALAKYECNAQRLALKVFINVYLYDIAKFPLAINWATSLKFTVVIYLRIRIECALLQHTWRRHGYVAVMRVAGNSQSIRSELDTTEQNGCYLVWPLVVFDVSSQSLQGDLNDCQFDTSRIRSVPLYF